MSLEKFLQNIFDNKCPFRVKNQDEVDDIESAVKDGLVRILEHMASQHPLTTISDILPAGGFYEETKIENPDEFDYMLVCHYLSLENEFTISKGCPGSVTLTPLSYEHYDEFCKEGCLYFASNKHEEFSKNVTSISDFFEFLLKSACEVVEKCIQKKFGSLYIIGAAEKSLSFSWESYCDPTAMDDGLIDVDIMPCIRIPEQIKEDILCEVPASLHKYIIQDGCHIVPKKCSTYSNHPCCQLSFTRSEVFLIREMNDHHKKCYKILKVISKQMSALCFDSYVMKTSVLHHVYIENCSELGCINSCIFKIVSYLKTTSEDKFLPNLFLPSKNIWEHSMVGSDEEIDQFYKAQGKLANPVIIILEHISEINIEHYKFMSCLQIFEKLSSYLHQLSLGKIKFEQLEERMTKYLTRRQRNARRCNLS